VLDRGIKNLAFCILEKEKEGNGREKENEKLKIIKWDLINLTNNSNQCTCLLKNNNMCGKVAQFYHPTNDKIFYCKTHAKQYEIPILNILDCNNTKLKCHECEKKCKYIINDQNYCSTHSKDYQKEFTKNNKLCNIKKKSCMKVPLYDLCVTLYKILDTIPEILEVKTIVIENQPSFNNPTMKSISILLFSYYVMKKHEDIRFVAPSGKLKINSNLTKKILSSCDKKRKYNVTKELGIKYCEELLIKCIEDPSEYIKNLYNSKKKDDLCDAFLHAYYHFIGDSGLESEEFINKTIKYFIDKNENKKEKNNKDNTIIIDI
jgi:hypothetical protein